ncbi:MAG: hypothetical protein KME47_07945 [Nodosilinea sp. WJT8-NPBG4]|jgi:hypothetical protein|nr:hypothetical protein [Nodosilinea sp. WJT8-NPBG4]
MNEELGKVASLTMSCATTGERVQKNFVSRGSKPRGRCGCVGKGLKAVSAVGSLGDQLETELVTPGHWEQLTSLGYFLPNITLLILTLFMKISRLRLTSVDVFQQG